MFKGIIFDLDGLLIDSEIVSYQLYQDLIKPYGYSFSIEDYSMNYSGKTAIRNMASIIERFHLPITIEEGLDFTNNKEKEYFKQGVKLKKGARELLEYLKENNYKIILASSSTQERAMNVLKQNKIDIYFDDFVFGSEVTNGKPHPDIFLKACDKLGLETHECLVLEDSEAGIQASYSAHIPVICIPDMKEPQDNYKEKTVRLLSSLNEVIVYLKENREYKMVAFDMDGTLLNSQKQISKKTIEAIQKAIHRGKIVIFNTGRCPSELEEYFEVLEDIQYLNCISGALVYDRKNNKNIYSKSLDKDTVIQLLQIANQEDTMVQLLNKDSIIEKDKLLSMEKYHMAIYTEMYERVTVKLENIYTQYMKEPFSVEKFNIYHTSTESREKSRYRIENLGLEVEIANAEETSIEISPKNVNKGESLKKLCEYLNISMSEVVVVGDADNDIAALKVAGLSIAMGNAKKHIKDICDVVVADNDHDGCVEVIEKYL